jgi:RNA recognition motif-containing protein
MSATTSMTYEEIMGNTNLDPNKTTNSKAAVVTASTVAITGLSRRLQTFRQWLVADAHAEIHPSICLVNGEATDGTKNAPVLILEKQSSVESSTNTKLSNGNGGGGSKSSSSSTSKNAAGSGASAFDGSNVTSNTTASNGTDAYSATTQPKVSTVLDGRIGMIDNDIVTSLYDRTMGCQVRAVREMKPNDTIMTLPRSSMVTPDLVGSSCAGRAAFACCDMSSMASLFATSVWDILENTTICESKQMKKILGHSGTQTLVKILQERKRAETAYKQRIKQLEEQNAEGQPPPMISFAEYGTISTRAPYLLFLIHQRFYNSVHVPVSSSTSFNDTTERDMDSGSLNTAIKKEDCDNSPNKNNLPMIQVPVGSPTTFAPYARTLPSSVSVPLCWKRSELAMLSGCIPGLSLLHEVGGSTMLLVAEFIALLNAGILERFPNVFPPGILTWDRYVWAASVFSSRNLPAASYYNKGDSTGSTFQPSHPLEFQSPPEIWDELGVLVPLLDMFNHEVEDHQVTWEQSCLVSSQEGTGTALPESNGNNRDKAILSHSRAILHKKVKKGSEIYSCYGPSISNAHLVVQYGFAQINNVSDEVRLGWAIVDAVGNVSAPVDFIPPHPVQTSHVYESNDEDAINAWWTDDRWALLEVEACCSDHNLLSNLKLKRKMSAKAYADGHFDPILLATLIVATMPAKEMKKVTSLSSEDDTPKRTITISKRHQQIIQRYLQFYFTRKLEKLLHNLNTGLSDFFSNLKLWTKCTEGGLHYQPKDNGEGSTDFIGWQSFFDLHAYKATMEVENHYYAMGSSTCVLTLYDGQLRALQASLNIVSDSSTFTSVVLKQMEDLGYEISDEEDQEEEDDDMIEDARAAAEEDGEKVDSSTIGLPNGNEKRSPRSRKRNRKRNNRNNHSNNNARMSDRMPDRMPVIKLHLGNLSYNTTPAHLYDYFSSIYGRDRVLECHIPVEKETGKPRGFGFVSFPEGVAENVLKSGRNFEMNGRVLKIARSSSAGPVGNTKVLSVDVQPPINNERCQKCGYRPKYCVCSQPHVGGMQRSFTPNAFVRNDPIGSRDFGPDRYYRDNDYRGRDYREDIDRRRDYDHDRGRYNRSHHPDDDYRRGFDRDDEYHRGRGRLDRDISPRDYRERDHSPHDSKSRNSSRRPEHDDGDSARRRDLDNRESSRRRNHGDGDGESSRRRNHGDGDGESSRRRNFDHGSVTDDDDNGDGLRSQSKERSSRRKKHKRRRSCSPGSKGSRSS